jgi:hypothetical protein
MPAVGQINMLSLRCFTLTLAVMIAAGCSGQPSSVPTPKSPAALEQLLPQLPPARPKLPWEDDISSQDFPDPLPVSDAERILKETGLFNRNAWRQVQAYNVLMDQPDGLVRFQAIARTAKRAGQVYALCALWALDAPSARALAEQLAPVTDEIAELHEDVISNRSIAELVRLVQDKRIWVELRSLRDEAYLRYKKTG